MLLLLYLLLVSLSQIVARELRLVRVHPVQAAAPGRTATFVLLKRPRDSIIAEAVQQQEGEGGPVIHHRLPADQGEGAPAWQV